MADTVQYLLESSVPELDDLHSRGLFSKVAPLNAPPPPPHTSAPSAPSAHLRRRCRDASLRLVAHTA
jgi:hypothetical protein